MYPNSKCCFCIPLPLGVALVSAYCIIDCILHIYSIITVYLFDKNLRDLSLGKNLSFGLLILHIVCVTVAAVCIIVSLVFYKNWPLFISVSLFVLAALVSLVLGTVVSAIEMTSDSFIMYIAEFIVYSFFAYVVLKYYFDVNELQSSPTASMTL